MSLNTILATAPLTTTNFVLKATGTTIGNSLIFDNGTNVGINTASPVSTNLVGSQTIVKSYNSDTPVSTTAQTYYTNQSNLYLFGRNAGISIICPATSEEGSIFFGNSLSVAYASINTGSGTTSVGGDMNFRVGSNTTRMTITSSGNVGIGTVSPTRLLDVNGVIRTQNSGSAGAPSIELGTSAQGNGLFYPTTNTIAIATNDTERMRITSAGLVGIGTSSPVQTLHIKAPSGSTTGLRLESSGGTTNFDILSSEGDGNVYLYQRSNYSILIGTNNTERMRITSGGNVGIGTTGFSDVRCAVTGVDTTSSNFAFICKNGGGTNLFNLRNDGWLGLGLASVSPYNNTSSSAANGLLYSDGSFGRSTSSIRYKKDVEDLTINTSDLLSKMRPVWYRSKCSNDNSLWSYYGFIAEELAEIEPRLIHWGYPSEDYDEQGKLNEDSKLRADGVQYDRITVLLVAEIQKMNQIIQELNERLNKLESK
jgi:hypothetical protein